MAWRKIKCTKSPGQKRSEFSLHLSWVQKSLALAWGLLLTIVVTSPISHCLWTSASPAWKESSDASWHPSCGHEMGWGWDATQVICGSVRLRLEVPFAFKSTSPVRTLLVPSVPLGGMLTHGLLGKNRKALLLHHGVSQLLFFCDIGYVWDSETEADQYFLGLLLLCLPESKYHILAWFKNQVELWRI